MYKLLVGFQLALLITYVIFFQAFFNAGFKSHDSFAKEEYVYILWWAVLLVSATVSYLLYRDMKLKNILNKTVWCIYIFITCGIGTVHYYFKFIHNGKNTL
jgi:hypothetical protein